MHKMQGCASIQNLSLLSQMLKRSESSGEGRNRHDEILKLQRFVNNFLYLSLKETYRNGEGLIHVPFFIEYFHMILFI